MVNKAGNPNFGKSIVGKKRAPKPQEPEPSHASLVEVNKRVDEFISQHITEYLDTLHLKATKGRDKQAAMYLFDRLLGKIGDRSSEKDEQLESTLTRLLEAAQKSSPQDPPLDDNENPLERE